MLEKMAMVDEPADDTRIPEIHSQFDAWISAAFTVPILDVDGVAQEWLIYRRSGVWLLVSSAPFCLRKFSRCGICSRSEGTFGLSRSK